MSHCMTFRRSGPHVVYIFHFSPEHGRRIDIGGFNQRQGEALPPQSPNIFDFVPICLYCSNAQNWFSSGK